MKIARAKKSHKTLVFFATHFGYREPYQVLVDATFCQAALQNKVFVDEQVKRYFHTQVKLVTTQCIILEAESLGGPLVGATQIVKKFFVHKCGHEGKPITASQCIKSMTKDSRYIVATQDRTLQESLRKVPGRCLLYLHRAAPVLETPSAASKKYVLKKSQSQLMANAEERIEHMKKAKGLPTTSKVEDATAATKKRKGPKNPNPLSCRKSKKTKPQEGQTSRGAVSDKSKTEMKPKRKRMKIPTHVKEALKKGQHSS